MRFSLSIFKLFKPVFYFIFFPSWFLTLNTYTVAYLLVRWGKLIQGRLPLLIPCYSTNRDYPYTAGDNTSGAGGITLTLQLEQGDNTVSTTLFRTRTTQSYWGRPHLPNLIFTTSSFSYHVKVGPTPVLALRNFWRQMHMFLDILFFGSKAPCWRRRRRRRRRRGGGVGLTQNFLTDFFF